MVGRAGTISRRVMPWAGAGIFLMVGLALAVVNPTLIEPPWETTKGFRYPSTAVSTPQGGVLVNDVMPNGDERLTALDSQGQLVFRLSGGDRAGNYNFNYPVCDEQGRIFYVQALWNTESGQREDFGIIGLEADGTHRRELFHHTNTPEELAAGSWGYLEKIQYSQGEIWFVAQHGAGSLTVVHLNPVNGQMGSQVVDTGTDQLIVDFAVTNTGRTVLLTEDYQLLEVSGTETTVLPSAKGEILVTINAIGDTLVAQDSLGQNIVQVASDGRRTTLLSRSDPAFQDLVSQGFYFPQLLLSRGPGGWLVPDSDRNRLVQLQPNRPPKIWSSYTLSLGQTVAGWTVWLSIGLALILLGSQGVRLVQGRGRFPIYVKQLSIFLPFLVASLTLAAQIVFREYDGQVEQEAAKQFLSIAQTASRTIDATPLETLRSRADLDRQEIQELFGQLDVQVNGRQDPWNQDLYTYIYLPDASGTLKFGFNDGAYFTPFGLTDADKRLLSGQSQAETRTYSDVTGTWTSALAPLYNRDHQVVGIFEVYKSSVILEERRTAFTWRTLGYALGAVAVFTILYFISTYFILRGIKLLVRATERMADNDFTSRIHLKSRDEIEDLGRHFNRMAGEVESRMGHIAALNASYYRFVPEAFLRLLQKDITAIGLGDKVEREVTILFSDIRDFTPLSESMSPEEGFRFLNRYLESMGPVIRQHGGFIDKYIGDGIMAIFPDEPEQAVRAGLAMGNRLVEFNAVSQNLGLPAIRIGVGINTGQAMMGVIGEDQRFECTVISDSVNLASRLESATKDFGVAVLVSQSTRSRSQAPEIEYRPLGSIQVKGRREPVEVFTPVPPPT